ncbi:GNAT family N-acetyltransferase [Nonomuraea sp. NPDC001023]|uniref:GNAT family N-acetyltransferase n=1 Tax=unclassified Nonomuraea TaxID=2593643 RepID=UPI00331D88B2
MGPYRAYSSDLAWVLAAEGDAPVGYFLAVADTVAFEDRLEREWWPPLRARGPRPPVRPGTPDAWLRSYVDQPPRTPTDITTRFPAHIHVDLLPEAQGGGYGRRLWETAMDALRRRGVHGVHLGVAARNTDAQGFYRHLGLHLLAEDPGTQFYGMRL